MEEVYLVLRCSQAAYVEAYLARGMLIDDFAPNLSSFLSNGIQPVINRECGLAMNENPNQDAFIIDELTDLVEVAARVCSLGQITTALYEVGGQYRRSM